MQTRRVLPIIGTLTLLVFQSLELRAAEVAAARPNILWLIGEDLGPAFGCYGVTQVKTPNVDRLAADGMRFTRCYNGHVCSPSRSAFMTGMYATSIGANDHRSNRDGAHPLPDGVKVLTDWMRGAGYFTANLVKLPEACGFKGSGKTDWNFTYDGNPFDSANWADLRTSQPFFAQLNFQETHRTFHAPPRTDPAKVDLPPYYPDHPVARKDWAEYLDSAIELDRKIGVVLAQLERDGLASNTVVVFFGDNGEAHVRSKQFCYDSSLHVPLVIRWPAAFPAPAGFKAGAVDARLVHGIDLAPTMLALAGATKPERMEGRVLFGATREPDREFVFGARDRCDETVMRIRTVRDARYRYIRNFMPEVPLLAANAYKQKQYPVWKLLQEFDTAGKLTPEQAALCAPTRPAEELYDLETDPHEVRNLADSKLPEHTAALKRLRAALAEWMAARRDPETRPPDSERPPVPEQKGKKNGGSRRGA